MRFSSKMADASGVLALGVFAAFAAYLVALLYSRTDAVWAWCLGFPVLSIAALAVWHSEKWPHDATDALRFAVGSATLGAAFFAVDLMIGTGQAPNLPIRYAVWRSGTPFGIVLTIVVCPGVTSIALGGAVRERLLKEHQSVPPQKGKYVFLKLGK